MIVCVESNFILELAFMREEHESCSVLLTLAESHNIELVLPAFSIGEPYEVWVRRYKQRKELHNKLSTEIQELSRSKPYQESSKEYQELTSFLIKTGEEEKRRLDESLDRILNIAKVIPIGLNTIRAAINYQKILSLSPQDSIVYASIIDYLAGASGNPGCFITKNSKDFANPDIKNELVSYNCRLLTTFKDGLGYIRGHS
jgi:predicted nucleic acid-binding protein